MCPTSMTAAPGLIQSPLIWWQTKNMKPWAMPAPLPNQTHLPVTQLQRRLIRHGLHRMLRASNLWGGTYIHSTYHHRLPSGCNDYVSLAYNASWVRGPWVHNGYSRIGLEKEQRHRQADDVAAANHNCDFASDTDPAPWQELHACLRRKKNRF
jgi:hypothetical protein